MDFINPKGFGLDGKTMRLRDWWSKVQSGKEESVLFRKCHADLMEVMDCADQQETQIPEHSRGGEVLGVQIQSHLREIRLLCLATETQNTRCEFILNESPDSNSQCWNGRLFTTDFVI